MDEAVGQDGPHSGEIHSARGQTQVPEQLLRHRHPGEQGPRHEAVPVRRTGGHGHYSHT